MSSSRADIHDNIGWADARPIVSVLIPFLRDDPEPLLRRLDTEAAALAGRVELVLLDDGTGDAALTARLKTAIDALALPARLVTLSDNEGRARGRNRLTIAARGQAWLFLDSDMKPDDARFLQVWVDLAGRDNPAVAFGGFSLKQAPRDRRFAVHRALSGASECVRAAQRARTAQRCWVMLSCSSRATSLRSASCACTTRCVKVRSMASLRRASVMSVTTMPKVGLLEPFLASGRMEICADSCEPSPA